MKNTCLAILLCCLSNALVGQEQPPKLLVEAGQCLAAKKHLPLSEATALRFGYLVDTRSYPGRRVRYIVDYMALDRSEGMVFAILVTKKDGRQSFNIQNNAKFVKSPDGIEGIDFVEPPLGGIWTQQHLVAAIKRIEEKPIFMVPVKDLLAPCPLVRCASYTDRK